MNDLRRTVLWVVFSMSLVLLWDAWNKHQGHPSMFGPSQKAPAVTTLPDIAPTVGPGSVPQTTVAGGVASPPAQAAAQTSARPTSSETVTVQTDVLRATVDTRGGDVIRVELLDQIDQLDRTKNVVVLDRSAERVYLAQTGLVGAAGLPNHVSMFTLLPGPTTLAADAAEVAVTFESIDPGDVKLRKTLVFHRSSHVIDVRHDIVNTSAQTVSPQVYVQLVRDGNPPPGESSFYHTFTGPVVYEDAHKFHKVDFKDIEKGKADIVKSADNGWVAIVQHYFVAAWLHNEPAPREFYARKVDNNLYAVGELFAVGAIASGQTKSFISQLFVGPQEEKKLETLAPGLELVKDYGLFTILAKPLFWLLDHLHQLIGNWGWSIVALVVLIKAAFFSLNASAYRSMAKMKSITPKINEMRARLKDKPQQMQQEMMRIYKEEKVNPIGSCLPILVQMPVFFALYWVLLSSVEMRNAPWIGWITDLSVKDPLFILPIVMTGTSLLQTWLNPTPPDPVQAKMMWIMPLVFSVMFFFFPAGLVLYWITNNLLSIAQQWVINKRLGVA